MAGVLRGAAMVFSFAGGAFGAPRSFYAKTHMGSGLKNQKGIFLSHFQHFRLLWSKHWDMIVSGRFVQTKYPSDELIEIV